MNYIPKKIRIEYAPDGTPCICGNTIINKDGITEIQVLDNTRNKDTKTYIDEETVLCAIKMGDIIKEHIQSEKENGYYYFRIVEVGKHHVVAVPDGGVIEI